VAAEKGPPLPVPSPNGTQKTVSPAARVARHFRGRKAYAHPLQGRLAGAQRPLSTSISANTTNRDQDRYVMSTIPSLIKSDAFRGMQTGWRTANAGSRLKPPGARSQEVRQGIFTTKALHILNGTGDLETVRMLLGHAKIESTALYLCITKKSDPIAISRALRPRAPINSKVQPAHCRGYAPHRRRGPSFRRRPCR
jgi:hypothetical protein